MKTDMDLRELLREIDHKGYPSYKRTSGAWEFKGFTLSIDHVQSDPFASPSNVSVMINGRVAAFPKELFDEAYKRTALEDYLLRCFSSKLAQIHVGNAGSGKSGQVYTSRPGQERLKRSALSVDEKDGAVVARFEVGFPARGRTVSVGALERIFFDILPKIVAGAFYYKNADKAALKAAIDLAEDQYVLRAEIERKGLLAFVANDSILPRESGVSQRPMKEGVPFQSPNTLEVEIDLPHYGRISGMGIRKGIFLIVGGGYHGKSTLLSALERGVYDHIKGDGREYVVTRSDAMKIRAEDGRSVKGTDVSLFINNLPSGKDTKSFSTENASGSTSQAANVIEALETGSKLLLIDEDTSATNFMVRDELMRGVVGDDDEPITPFIFRMRQMYENSDISTILVAGSSGSFFGVADTVIQMDEYIPKDVTERAKQAYEAAGFNATYASDNYSITQAKRIPRRVTAWAKPDARVKIKALSAESFSIDREMVDLRAVEQLADKEQIYAIAYALKLLAVKYFDGRRTLSEAIEALYADIENRGVELLCGRTVGCGTALPRKEEIYAAVNRWRGLQLGQG